MSYLRPTVLTACCILALGLAAHGGLGGGEGSAATPPDQVRLSRLMPDLAAALPLGPTAQGVWTGAVDRDAAGRGRFLLNNDTNETSIYYGYRLDEADAADDLSVEVSLPRSGVTQLSGAGLLFDFQPAGPNYCAFVLHPDGVAGIYARDRKGLHPLAQARAADFRAGHANRLTLRRSGDSLAAFVNGSKVLQLADLGPSCPGPGATGGKPAAGMPVGEGREGSGIIALSVGRFGFRDFHLQ
ncbi:hypothetical protein ACFOGJ_08170 [Marinibaculum pumilum]|uniref:DUF1080 domain-containing protein n=1 Tax=Marinibaculum pumilum TaxID=1766165 RepID=A0ABV7KXR3_9PROT